MEEEKNVTPQSSDTPEKTEANTETEKPKKKKALKIFIIVVSVLLVLLIGGGCFVNVYVDNLIKTSVKTNEEFKDSDEDLGIEYDAFEDDAEEPETDVSSVSGTSTAQSGQKASGQTKSDTKKSGGGGKSSSGETVNRKYINIALFGVDTRGSQFVGSSDSIMILTIDKSRNKIKLTSLARDTYVTIEGYGKGKLGHAYAKGGPQLAVKTINQTFNMNIRDYVTINFYGFVKMIDYLGGVKVNVTDSVFKELNGMSVGENSDSLSGYAKLTRTGWQTLNGKQALSYARTRNNTGGDVARSGRQREVLDSAIANARQMGIVKLPELIRLGLENCETSLSPEEIKELGTWALLSSPKGETYAVPDGDCNPKYGDAAFLDGIWYFFYDLDTATRKIHDFIKETGTYKK